jgi:hypothetical protein
MARRGNDPWTSPLFLFVVGLAAAVIAFTVVVVLSSDDPLAGGATGATTSTSAAAATTTSASVSADGVATGWYAVVRSDVDSRTTPAAFASAAAAYGNRGHVIDTDAYRTGDGKAPDFFPSAHVVALVVGPFTTLQEATAYCEGTETACSVRQLVPV